jgi:Mrp family chromosome partitioning ATPase
MSSVAELRFQTPVAAEEPHVIPIQAPAEASRRSNAPNSLHEGQIQALVQQLFFRRESNPVRHVGFAPVETSASTAALCLAVATCLAEGGRYDVGLIDASPQSTLLQTQLQIPSPPGHGESNWLIAPRLWLVSREDWLPYSDGQKLNDKNLSRLTEVTSQFDFSILWCPAVSWLTTSIAQACDGLALVLTANKTRRLVAAQVKDQLTKAQIPLLGTILVDRRFPVPQGLYRSL